MKNDFFKDDAEREEYAKQQAEIRCKAETSDRYRHKPTISGESLRCLGALTRDSSILRDIYEEACVQAIMDGLEGDKFFISIQPRHVHKAAGIVQKRRNTLDRNALKAAVINNLNGGGK